MIVFVVFVVVVVVKLVKLVKLEKLELPTSRPFGTASPAFMKCPILRIIPTTISPMRIFLPIQIKILPFSNLYRIFGDDGKKWRSIGLTSMLPEIQLRVGIFLNVLVSKSFRLLLHRRLLLILWV
jgi:hypothetical protein